MGSRGWGIDGFEVEGIYIESPLALLFLRGELIAPKLNLTPMVNKRIFFVDYPSHGFGYLQGFNHGFPQGFGAGGFAQNGGVCR